MNIGRFYFGWHPSLRFEWMARREYWYRCVCGPVYVLRSAVRWKPPKPAAPRWEKERDEAQAIVEAFDAGQEASGLNQPRENPYPAGDSWGVPMTYQLWEDGYDLMQMKALKARCATLTGALERARTFLEALGWSSTGGTNLRDQIDAALAAAPQGGSTK